MRRASSSIGANLAEGCGRWGDGDMGRFLQIDEVGAMVSWIASPECSFTTGFTFDLTGGRATY